MNFSQVILVISLEHRLALLERRQQLILLRMTYTGPANCPQCHDPAPKRSWCQESLIAPLNALACSAQVQMKWKILLFKKMNTAAKTRLLISDC